MPLQQPGESSRRARRQAKGPGRHSPLASRCDTTFHNTRATSGAAAKPWKASGLGPGAAVEALAVERGGARALGARIQHGGFWAGDQLAECSLLAEAGNKKSQASVRGPVNALQNLTGAPAAGATGISMAARGPGQTPGGMGSLGAMGQPSPGTSRIAPHSMAIVSIATQQTQLQLQQFQQQPAALQQQQFQAQQSAMQQQFPAVVQQQP
ncbi:uncharacterized protein ACIGJ3_019168 [Trichechus inunguis]